MDEVTTTLAPIQRSVTLNCTVERAFAVFTDEISSWWPLDTHSITAGSARTRGMAAASVVVEGRVGGRVYEIRPDGSEAHWAEVLVWEPPHRLVLAWKPNEMRAAPTEVEVTFTELDDGRTRLDLEHRAWERLGQEAVEARAGYVGREGWTAVLERFRGALPE
jgi:uncharacterized protein YndB with AHSA1/START domain